MKGEKCCWCRFWFTLWCNSLRLRKVSFLYNNNRKKVFFSLPQLKNENRFIWKIAFRIFVSHRWPCVCCNAFDQSEFAKAAAETLNDNIESRACIPHILATFFFLFFLLPSLVHSSDISIEFSRQTRCLLSRWINWARIPIKWLINNWKLAGKACWIIKRSNDSQFSIVKSFFFHEFFCCFAIFFIVTETLARLTLWQKVRFHRFFSDVSKFVQQTTNCVHIAQKNTKIPLENRQNL